MNYSFNLIRIGKIAGIMYRKKEKVNTLVIYGLGAPVVPDNGNLPDAPVIMKFSVDLFVPDYIGYGRSDGRCTPKNCINTFLQLYDNFTKGCTGKNHYTQQSFFFKYKRIIYIGRSFGGTYIPLLPRFDPSIKELAIIYPAVDNKSSGAIIGEESNEDFMRAMKADGYRYLYRGILSSTWDKHLQNKDGLSPMDNIRFLENSRLFIAHGLNDRCINYSKSVKYYKDIIKNFPDKETQFKLKLYKNGDHSPKTSKRAVRDILKWFKV